MWRLCRASGYGGGYGFGLYGGYGGGGLNRASWREKSDAATRREDLAKKTFNEKLATLANDTDTIRAFQHYPKQQLLVSGLIEPQVHLTGPCWKTFKQHVIAKQCSVRRRKYIIQKNPYPHTCESISFIGDDSSFKYIITCLFTCLLHVYYMFITCLLHVYYTYHRVLQCFQRASCNTLISQYLFLQD